VLHGAVDLRGTDAGEDREHSEAEEHEEEEDQQHGQDLSKVHASYPAVGKLLIFMP
jgi:hypothetical protein